MPEADRSEKTEEATPRRLETAREEGQVAMSSEFLSVMMLTAAVAGVVSLGGRVMHSGGTTLADVFAALPSLGLQDYSAHEWAELVKQVLGRPLPVLALVMTPPLIVGLLVGYGQVGLLVTPKAVGFKPEKLDPRKGFGRMFGARGWMRTVLAALKITLVMTVMGAVAASQMGAVSRLAGDDLGPVLRGTVRIVLWSVSAGLLVLVLLSLFDLLFQRWQFSRDMRMSKKEVRDEQKTTDGDPHVKARIRRIQRELASQRMMEEVPKATVVVTNPTHYAVALSYARESDEARGRAPRLVAKGTDATALRIREIAAEHDVPRVEDRPLARALYAQVKIGDEVPAELFQAVAAVLAYVYQLQEEKRGRSASAV